MELYTRRTIAQCLSEGWTLISTDFGRLLKNLWAPALLLAVVAGAFGFVLFNTQQYLIMNFYTPGDFLMPVLLWLAMLCAAVLFEAKIFKLLNGQTTRWSFWRMAKMTALIIGITIIMSLVFNIIAVILRASVYNGTVNPTIGFMLIDIVLIALIIALIIIPCPLLYATVKYMIEPETRIRDTWKNYKRGWQNFGKIFAFLLITALICILVQFIVSLPTYIMILASNVSLAGMAFGDPAGLPTNFMYTYAITTAISSLISCVLMTWFTLSSYYLYASIEAKYRE